MPKRKAKTAATRNLSADELSTIAGGQEIYTREFAGGPPSGTPVFGPPKSIAAGEINENSTDDNLPD